MSIKNKYLKEEDLEKFDKFIQDSLYKYFYVQAWDRLYTNTGADHHYIISDKSTIPDLVIYNKTFNKSHCFFHSNKNSKFIKFPRVQFLLRPKKINYYNPSCTYGDDEKEKEKEEEDNLDNLKPFEFKSIPKEIENQYINNNKKINDDNYLLFDELNDFMKSDKDNETETKVKIIQESENKETKGDNEQKKDKGNNGKKYPKQNNNQNVKNQNNVNYHKNKFETPINMNNMNMNMNINLNPNIIRNINLNNYLAIQQKMMQNYQYQNYINKKIGNNYILNNNHANKFNPSQIENKEKIYNEINKNTGEQNSNNLNAISYFKNTNSNEIVEFEKYINNMDEIFKNNINKRGWKVVNNKKNIVINKFNNQELYYFLNVIINKDEINNFSISDLESDFFFNPISIYERLKDMFNYK